MDLLVIPVQHCSSAEAVNRIYKIKGRKLGAPWPFVLLMWQAFHDLLQQTTCLLGYLISSYPEPVTVVLKQGSSSSPLLLKRSKEKGLSEAEAKKRKKKPTVGSEAS